MIYISLNFLIRKHNIMKYMKPILRQKKSVIALQGSDNAMFGVFINPNIAGARPRPLAKKGAK